MADLATAYLLLVPSLKGAEKTIEKELGGISGEKVGGELGDSMGEGLIGKMGGIAKKAAGVLAGAFATKKVFDFGKAAFDAYADFEQLSGGVEKIFDEMDTSRIMADANSAWLDLNMSANDYMESINQVGSMFAQTMGDEKGYDVARKGMKAISDYATGTGRDLNMLNEKFAMITRSTSSYQSIADQFAGVLPATSKDFLEQAQAAGLLGKEYENLTDVPVAEYQQAISAMLEKGTKDLGLADNTAKEALGTLSGSILATKSAWDNLVAEFGKPDADIGARISDMMTAVMGKDGQGGLLRNVAGEVGVIARNVIGSLGEGLTKGIDWLVANAPSMVQKGIQRVVEAAEGFDLASMLAGDGGGLAAGVATAISDIGEIISEWTPDIILAVAGVINQVGAFLVANAPTFLANVASVVAGVADYLASWFEINGPILLETIGSFFQNVFAFLVEQGPGIVSSLAQLGMQALVWLSEHGLELVGQIGEVIANVVNYIVEHREEILAAIGQALQGIVNAIVTYGPTILQNVAAGIGKLAGYLVGAAGELLAGLLQSLKDHWTEIKDWFYNLPQTIRDALGDLGTVLLDAGRSLISGFFDGLTEKFKDVQEWVGGVGQWIADHKGPKAYDLKLLVPNAEWIMQGFEDSLKAQIPSLEATVGGISAAMQDTLGQAYGQRRAVPAYTPRPAATGASGWAGVESAVNGLRGDMAGIGIYLDGNVLVGHTATRMDKALAVV